jgi:hypothetical protein
MFSQVFASTDCPDLVVLHDSEDIIDARTFAVYAAYAADHDFIQVPVFSLNRGKGAHVASTYMDEFAERHTREMIVRDAVGAAIPSAGVGTCMTKRLIRHFLSERGQVLMSGTVTEDYILGIEGNALASSPPSLSSRQARMRGSTSSLRASFSPGPSKLPSRKKPGGSMASPSRRCTGSGGRAASGIAISSSTTAKG